MPKDVPAFDTENVDSSYGVLEDRGRLRTLLRSDPEYSADSITAALRCDQVVLVQNVPPLDANIMVASVAETLGILDRLELQAACASIQGHRENIGKYFMSVDRRGDYQFIPSHSEGHRNAGIQLACFYCFENTTDGGATVLQNVDQESESWNSLREVVAKIDPCGKTLTAPEIAEARLVHFINAEDALTEDDVVVRERQPPFAGVRSFDVLTKPRREYSLILDRPVYAYWGSIGSRDFDSGRGFLRLLRHRGLLREPRPGSDIGQLDYTHPVKVWSSGVQYEAVFKSMIVQNLVPGDLVILNNLTWTHASGNWTPGSGSRTMAAAFA